ncbi:MAG TPA: O-antigen ligase family protein [Phenylobacterium sp.]|jgi:hypothetical protein|nr:O-antigen ligase family protein [Phenylobacterium sp.]
MSMQFRTFAERRFATAKAALARHAETVVGWTKEFTPVVGLAAQRRRHRIVLLPYRRAHTLTWTLLRMVGIPLLVLGCLLYGFFFGLTAPFLLVPFAIPIVLLTALIIWALPDQRTAPTLPIEYLFSAYFVILVLWPRYLAITLPGMPWITFQRILGLPMALLLLISLSMSKLFRIEVSKSVSAITPLWIFLCGFVFIQMFTTFISPKPFAAAQLAFDEQIYWTTIFVISAVAFRKEGQIERYLGLLCTLSFFMVVLTAIEWRRQHVVWAAHIPAILRVPDPSVQNTLTPSFRPGTNFYRAKATFSTPLALAEYISLLTPFLLHFAFSKRNVIVRLACFTMVPLTFIAVRMTDARLGVVGVFSSVLLYGLLWSIVRWRTHPRDLFAAATVYAYPAVFLAGLAAIFSSTRLNQMVLGGGAQAGSTAARQTQLGMAMAKMWTHPWGFGSGQSGNAMGFAKGDFITIDNYFISLALDYGVLGVIFWYGMFIIAIVVAVRYCISARYGRRPEAQLLAPLAVSLTAFLIIKWVHGQSDNHSVYFMMLGMISALVYRLRHSPDRETASDAAPIGGVERNLAVYQR